MEKGAREEALEKTVEVGKERQRKGEKEREGRSKGDRGGGE